MNSSRPAQLCLIAAAVGASITFAADLRSQYAERPHLAGSGDPAVDCTGRSIKNARVRAIHTTDPTIQGGTAYFIERDPYLAYQLGRSLNFREFRMRDGVFDLNIANLAGPMPDGTTAKITANNQVSCSGCHNLPQGNPGGGVSFQKDSGFGRNTPHYFGAGITEMLALQIRTSLLRLVDRNTDGWVDVSEAQNGGRHLWVRPTQDGSPIDFGDPRLSNGTTGTPSLNNIFRVWYVDRQGRVVPGADRVDGVQTFGYNFELIVYGWGQGPGRSALNPTNRAFYWDPAKAHGGLESHDPSTNEDPDGDGISAPTLSGAIQFPVTHKTPDLGTNVDPLGFSRDDPDGDGYLNEISEGDLDLAEWFMLNAPRPAFAGTEKEYRHGVKLLQIMGCAECHVPEWNIRPRTSLAAETPAHAFAGDRRLFDFEVTWNDQANRLEGKLVPLYDLQGGSHVRRFQGFEMRGLFTDFRHHDMGEGFAENDFGGDVNTLWRTAPLWGVGSGFPWGHDGRSLSLEHAILRHDGEGAASKNAWLRAGRGVRKQLLDFLRNLVLYDIETLPADIDGDGRIAEHFTVAGQDTGLERFNAEWLFQVPVRIQGPFVNSGGQRVRSFAGTNVDQVYGQLLPLRVDSDGDGWPDVWDSAPNTVGYRDGVQ